MKQKMVTSALAAMSMVFAGAALAQGGYSPEQIQQMQHSHDRHDRHGERGAGPDHNFYRGDRLSAEYRNRQYVVDHWRAHHLSAPPRGYHWVQVGADYALVAVATGIIAQVLLSH